MGDLRNKISKIERAKAEKAAGDAWLRARGIDPDKALPLPRPLPTCHACPKTWNDNGGSLYGVYRADGTLKLHCDAHLPPDAKD